jgi:RNA polymerase sigma-70 factor (ECF subfamily)
MRRLVRLCAALAGPAAAEDIAQDTLLAMLRSGRRPSRAEDMDAWLGGVARNVARRHWRTNRPTSSLGEMAVDPSAEPDTDDDVTDGRAQLVRRAMARLSDADRSLLSARHLEGRRTGELAAQLGLSPAAASMRLTRASSALRRVLTEELSDEARSVGLRIGSGAWRPTPLWCTECGSARLEMLRSADRVAVRCRACISGPDGVGSEFQLGNRTLARIFAGVSQPAALARRAATWSHDYFSRPAEARQAPCTACGRLAPLLPYRRSDPALPLRHRVGLHVRGGACGETVSTSLGGLVASRPEAIQLRARAGRVRAIGAVATQVDGRAALVAGQRAIRGSAAVEVVVAADTLRLLSVRATT